MGRKKSRRFSRSSRVKRHLKKKDRIFKQHVAVSGNGNVIKFPGSRHGKKGALLIKELAKDTLKATWIHLLQCNMMINEMWSKKDLKRALEKNEYPTRRCMFTNLKPSKPQRGRGTGLSYIRKGIQGCLPNPDKKTKTKVMIHQLACWRKWGRPARGLTASHLCIGPKSRICCNPNHMVWEQQEENLTRFCCETFKSVKTFKCPHIPTCQGCKSCYGKIS